MYREHVAGVWRYVRTRVPGAADADDVTAEVFVKAMRSWDRFDDRRDSVGAWLIGIARHVVADWWARRSRVHGLNPASRTGEDVRAPPLRSALTRLGA